MTKKNKVIYLTPPHKYFLGSVLNKDTGEYEGGIYNGLDTNTAGAINAGVAAVSGLAGQAINGGLSSGVGNAMQGLSSVASAIPGPMGAVASAALNIGGGIVNRLVGTSVDQAKLDAANQGTAYLNNFNSTAETLDDIQGPKAQAVIEGPYKGGLLKRGKARRKNAALINQRLLAQDYANRNVENNIDNILDTQMDNMLASYAAFGGPLHTNGADWSNGLINVNTGGTHEQNPNEGVPMGMAPDGMPNLVEEGEVVFNDYVFSNRIKVPKAVRKKYKLRGTKDITFADAVKNLQKESEERPNDPISKRGLEAALNRLMQEQELIRQKREARKIQQEEQEYNELEMQGLFAKGGKMGHLFPGPGPYPNKMNIWEDPLSYYEGVSGTDYYPNFEGRNTSLTPDERFRIKAEERGIKTEGIPTPTSTFTPIYSVENENGIVDYTPYVQGKIGSSGRSEGSKRDLLPYLRYVPALGAGIGVFSDLMGWSNKPDYSNANAVLEATNNIRKVSPTFIGDYLRYTPLDRLYYANKLGAQAGATRRNLLNISGGNRGAAMAGLLGADYNAQGQLGNLYRQAEEYNLGQRERVANFNRGTNMFNAENDLKAQMANRENDKIKVDAAIKAAALRDAVDARVGAARSANLTNLFDSLGNIGIDAYNRMDRDRLIRAGVYGTLSQKPQEWSDKKWKAYQEALAMRDDSKAYGGKMKRKKRGITI